MLRTRRAVCALVLLAACGSAGPPASPLDAAIHGGAEGSAGAAGQGRRVHVAPSGSDSGGDGSQVRPFASIAKAAQALAPGDTCVLRAGVYRETVRPARSGEPGKPITFIAAGDGPVVISGAEPVIALAREANTLWKAQLPSRLPSARNQSLQVFFRGQMMHLARWPDHGPNLDRPNKAKIERFVSQERVDNWTMGVFEDEDLPWAQDVDLSGAGLYMQPDDQAWSWTFSGTITERKGPRLTLRTRSRSGRTVDPTTYAVGSRYHLFGKRLFLDAAEEWWADEGTGTLFFIPPAGQTPGAGDVEVKVRDLCFDLDERSHIRLENLELFACSVSTDRAAGGDGRGYDDEGQPAFPWRGGGSVAESEGVEIVNVEAKYLDHMTDVSGHFYLQWGQGTGIILSGRNHRIERSRIGPTACNGITLLGYGHRVTNNLIEHANYVSVDCAGINTGGAADSFDHEIDHNTVRHTGRSCITLRNLRNSNVQTLRARVHHNDLSGCMQQDWDGGGIYAAVTDLKWTRIDHNWVHDMKGFAVAGVYPDFCKNVIIDHNVIWNVEWGVLSQGQYDDGQSNALCYNNTIAVTNTSGTPYGPFGFAGNKGGNRGSVVRNNIVALAAERTVAAGFRPVSDAWGEADVAHNWFAGPEGARDPGFIDAGKQDFGLGESSEARGRARPVPTYERDGAKVPAFNEGTGPAFDLGAYAGAPWRAGCDHVPACTLTAPPAFAAPAQTQPKRHAR